MTIRTERNSMRIAITPTYDGYGRVVTVTLSEANLLALLAAHHDGASAVISRVIPGGALRDRLRVVIESDDVPLVTP